MIKGVDISIHQGDINFDQLKTAVPFVIMKVTEGTGFMDRLFPRNQAEARRVGMLIGYYHFARPDLGNTPEAEADWFLATCKPQAGEVLCLDYEPPSNPSDVVAWCKTFLERVFYKTGTRPLIYLNQAQVKGFNWKPVIDGGYGLWLAAYTATLPATPWPFVAIQQNSNAGTVAGISARVDTNLFFGDAVAWKKYGLVAQIDPIELLKQQILDLQEQVVGIRKSRDDWKDKYGDLYQDHEIALEHIRELITAAKQIRDIATVVLE